MPLPKDLESRVSALNERFNKCVKTLERLNALEADEEYHRVLNEEYMAIFRDACALAREAETTNTPHLPELLEAVQKFIDKAIETAFGESEMFDFMPSWAHDDEGGRPLVMDRSETKLPLAYGAVPALINALMMMGAAKEKMEEFGNLRPDPWKASMKRHPKTTPLARFRPELPPLTPTSANLLALSVYDARCEISSIDVISPIKLHLSPGSTCLFVNGMTGWKLRSPGLEYLLLDREGNTFSNTYTMVPGLLDIARHMTVDETRRLVFIGDSKRVKSYAWGTPDGAYHDVPFPTHTLDSSRVSGPMTVLPNGTIVRAGRGGAAVWDISALPTHGDDGEGLIGTKINVENTSRDDPEDIEPSSGSPPTSHIKFVDQSNSNPSIWRPQVNSPSTMLCAQDSMELSGYGCSAIDLEHGGKTTARYIGHGGAIADFSVSVGDPQAFLTACHDGFARLYDTRQSLPVVTFDACGEDGICEAVALAHPDGIPTVFTGTGKHEQIKVWDVRARTPVYELATGNNAVRSLAWDSKRNCLYAATECVYKDRMGYNRDYRPSKIPRREGGSAGDEGANLNNDPANDGANEDRYWPDRAWHGEDYYGYTFDAADNRLYRYAFKENPNTSVVPVYGSAEIGEQW